MRNLLFFARFKKRPRRPRWSHQPPSERLQEAEPWERIIKKNLSSFLEIQTKNHFNRRAHYGHHYIDEIRGNLEGIFDWLEVENDCGRALHNVGKGCEFESHSEKVHNLRQRWGTVFHILCFYSTKNPTGFEPMPLLSEPQNSSALTTSQSLISFNVHPKWKKKEGGDKWQLENDCLRATPRRIPESSFVKKSPHCRIITKIDSFSIEKESNGSSSIGEH